MEGCYRIEGNELLNYMRHFHSYPSYILGQPSVGFVKSGLATGNHELVILPIDPRCTRRRIARTFQFQIA